MTAITAMPEKAVVDCDITVAQAKEQGATRVYSKDTLAAYELSDNDTVNRGYVAVKEVVDENGYTKYAYSFAGAGNVFVMNADNYSINNKTVAFNSGVKDNSFDWNTTGVGEKDANDVSL